VVEPRYKKTVPRLNKIIRKKFYYSSFDEPVKSQKLDDSLAELSQAVKSSRCKARECLAACPPRELSQAFYEVVNYGKVQKPYKVSV
jgi:hypothetical protein